MRVVKCDICGSEEEVTSQLYFSTSALGIYIKVLACSSGLGREADVCEACLKRAISLGGSK